ncbi:hypothetical protein [Micromonospora auratinigra]|uniref:hypothetical protein n=1 Tax=Micromonospora auratinigra TaxID=261654 RepID=UPI000B8207E5|nr:hypothetical protein [Micromonospora auratinigra]
MNENPTARGGQFEWTSGRTLSVVGLAAVLGVAAMITHLGGSGAGTEWLGVSAGCALAVALFGRATTVYHARLTRVAQSGPATVRVREGRVVIPRRDVLPRILSAVLIAGALTSGWPRDGEGPVAQLVTALVVVVPMAVWMALLGFADRVVVTADALVVLTTFTRRSVPRRLAGQLHPTGQGALILDVPGGPAARIPVGMRGLWVKYRWNWQPAELTAAARIRAALDAVPPTSTGAEVTTGPRWGTIAVAAGTPVVVLTAVVALLAGLS